MGSSRLPSSPLRLRARNAFAALRARAALAMFVSASLTLAVVFASLTSLSSLAACNRSKPPAAPPAELADPTRFPHAAHASQACEPCHEGDDRPGRKDHAPCDQGQCHRAEFLRAPGPLCRNCHVDVRVGGTGVDAPLQPFPRANGWRLLPSTFSHAQHLDAGRIEAAVGFHLACSDCHPAGETGSPIHPSHEACARCHSEEVALQRAPTMSQCAGCHSEPTARPRARPRLIKGDLHFTHANHRADRAGTAIPCLSCHRDIAATTSYDDHKAPAVATCVPCHDDTLRVPSEQRMRECQTCHRDKRGSLIALAPRNHLPGTERPVDHTLAFRKDHGDAAARNAARCATCHTVMSGSPRDACDECHRVTAPFDHRLAWRELEHGTEAATSPDRCALCHNADTCKDCHSQVPRSHLPLAMFAVEHGALARVNVRSCMTCHEQASDCMGAGCHGGPSQPTGGARFGRPGAM